MERILRMYITVILYNIVNQQLYNNVNQQFSGSVVSDSLRPHGLLHARLPCPSPTPGVYSNSCPLSQWCHPTISSSVIPFSHLHSFPVSGSFLVSWLFASGGLSIWASASASVLPMSIQGLFPLGLAGLIWAHLFIHLSVDGHLGCFHLLAIVNSAAWTLGCIYLLNYSLLWIYALECDCWVTW